MKDERKSFLNRAWNEPQHFFLWLMIFSIAGLMAGFFLDATTPGFYPSERFQTIAILIVVGLGASAVTGLAGFLLALIPAVRRLLARLLQRRFFVLACVITLVALFYAEENWRGKHEWENYKHEWEAKGEHFDFASIVPPPVPPERNFAMTPVVFSCYGYILTRDGEKIMERDTNWVNRLQFDLGEHGNTNVTGYWAKGTLSNLKPWQDWYRKLAAKTNLFAIPSQPQSPAADVLLALSKYNATVEELREAAQLPECRFPLNYDVENPAMIFLPHLASFKQTSQLLQLRAIAELENNQSEKAFADVMLSLRLASFIRNEPTLIDLLVRMAMTDIAIQPIYEGLAKHQWNEAQLAAMQAELAKVDYLSDFNFCMRDERAFASKIIDYMSTKDRLKRFDELEGMGSDFESRNRRDVKRFGKKIVIFFMPQGWFELNKLTIARLHEKYLLQIIDADKHVVFPAKMKAVPTGQVNLTPFNFLAQMWIPSVTHCAAKSARGQLSVNLAHTGIILERYRLAHGEFPQSLAALTQQFIAQVPNDVMGGKPLQYRRTDDGNFVLYSIGWNEKDDGGVTGHRNGGSAPDFDSGDWVWRYPQK